MFKLEARNHPDDTKPTVLLGVGQVQMHLEQVLDWIAKNDGRVIVTKYGEPVACVEVHKEPRPNGAIGEAGGIG